MIRNLRHLGDQLKNIEENKNKGESDRENVRCFPQGNWVCGRQEISSPTHGAKKCEHAPRKDGEENGVQRAESETSLNPPNLALGFSLPHGWGSNQN
jgi:hypothetical protein